MLKYATCRAKTAGLSALCLFTGMADSVDCLLEADEGPSNVSFNDVMLFPVGQGPKWPFQPCLPSFFPILLRQYPLFSRYFCPKKL